MGRRTTAKWPVMAYTWHKQGLSLREIKAILADRGLKLSHEYIRQEIQQAEKLLTLPVDSKR